MVNQHFSRDLRWLRVQAHLDQEQLALCVGVQPHTVSDWERGRRRPNFKNQKALRVVFGDTALLSDKAE
jgi:DNA-binding transcriptional regulator YiaG